jgi:outer membrane biosynthesis protein TonB
VQTTIGKVSRKIVWHCDKSMDLDLPFGWKIEKVEDQLRIWDHSNPNSNDFIVINDVVDGDARLINLPAPHRSKLRRPIAVKLVKLRPPRPVYVNNPTLTALHTRGPRQLCAFYGQRYFLIRYRPVGNNFTIHLGNSSVFNFKKSLAGYTITARRTTVRVNVGGKKTTVHAGSQLELSEVDFFRCTVLEGIHWWRFRMVPTPDGQPPLETDETDEDLREVVRLQYSTVGFLSMVGVILFAIFVFTKLYPPAPKLIKAEVALKQPKIYPAFEEKKPIPPPPPPPPEPKVVEEPPKPPEPVKEPPKKVVKAPKVKHPAHKVAKIPKPEPAPVPPAPKVVKDPGPTPEQLAAAEKAREQAAEQKQMLNSLNFLSTSASRPAVDPANYENKEGKFANTPMVGGMTSKSNVLDKMAKGAPGSGDIKTKSSRGIASQLSFGKNKGLNDVQGKVSLGELVSKSGDPGSALGGGKGLEMSGPGEMSESQIEKALAKFLPKFQYCYEKALLSDAGLSGNLMVQWSITTSGTVTDSRIIKSQMNNNDLHKCILKVLKGVPFPKPKGGTVIVKKTFAFSSASM